MTARAYCAQEGHSVSSLYLWASKLRRYGERQESQSDVKLARVLREKPAVPATIVIELGELRVSMSANTDRETIIAVLTTLAADAAP
jgi:hypothetical protein